MKETTCPKCDAPAVIVLVFGKEWIQCDKGHKTPANEIKPPSSELDGFRFEESVRRL